MNLPCFARFGEKFEKQFDLKSDDPLDVYLGNSINHDRAKGTVTMSTEHNLMSCLETSGLVDCNGVDKRISSLDSFEPTQRAQILVQVSNHRGVVWVLRQDQHSA